MKKLITKAKRALWLLLSNPWIFWARLKTNICPLFSPVKSGEISLNGVQFYFDPALYPASQAMYYQVYQYNITSILKKFLREGDIFIDIGANIGYMAAYALGLVGKTGEVHAFEPVPKYFAKLLNIKQFNPSYHL